MHVRDLVLMLLREQFRTFPETFPYRYVPDDYLNTKVTFDVSYNKDAENYGNKPLIVVEREAQTTSPVVVGDLAASFPKVSFARGSTLVNSAITVKVISRIHAEVDIIGQTIFNIMLSYRTALPGVLGIHNIPSITLSGITRFEQDTMMFIAQIDMPFSMQYKWKATRTAEILQSIILGPNIMTLK